MTQSPAITYHWQRGRRQASGGAEKNLTLANGLSKGKLYWRQSGFRVSQSVTESPPSLHPRYSARHPLLQTTSSVAPTGHEIPLRMNALHDTWNCLNAAAAGGGCGLFGNANTNICPSLSAANATTRWDEILVLLFVDITCPGSSLESVLCLVLSLLFTRPLLLRARYFNSISYCSQEISSGWMLNNAFEDQKQEESHKNFKEFKALQVLWVFPPWILCH